MSKRRKVGDVVWLRANTGFVGESNRLPAEIMPEADGLGYPCMMGCDDEDCREWVTLWTLPDPETGKRYPLCHVCECEMFDEKQGDE